MATAAPEFSSWFDNFTSSKLNSQSQGALQRRDFTRKTPFARVIMIAYNSWWFHTQHELLCVFHGDRREGSKLKTALKKTHLPKVGFSFSAAPSYRYLPPLRQYTTIRHRETRSAPDPTATRHRETYPRASPAAKYLSTEVIHCPRSAPRRRPFSAQQMQNVEIDMHNITTYNVKAERKTNSTNNSNP